MKKLPPEPALKAAITCPECGVPLIVSPTLRRTKVQCPKCRSIIDLRDSKTDEPVPEQIVDPAGEADTASTERKVDERRGAREDATAMIERLGRLEAQVSSLKQEMWVLKTAARPWLAETAKRTSTQTPDTEAKPLPPWKRHYGSPDPEEPAPETAAESEQSTSRARDVDWAGTPEEDVLVKALSDVEGGEVVIRVAAGNPGARHFGEWLRHAFLQAKWSVLPLEVTPPPPDAEAIILSTSARFPFPHIALTIHQAFAAAGLRLVFGIEPDGDRPIPALIVP